VIGDEEETERVTEIIRQTGARTDMIFKVSPKSTRSETYAGNLSQLDQIVHIHNIDEIVFCAKNISAGEIIQWMTRIPSEALDFKIAQPDTLSLIGSNSIDTAGEHYVLNVNSISIKENERKKRILDLIFSVFILILSPVMIWFFAKKTKFIKNLFSVLVGKTSFVGYNTAISSDPSYLPKLRPGLLFPSDEYSSTDIDLSDKLNLIYARDYSLLKDLTILSKAWTKLDR
jgi:hypothetical protein